MNKIKETLSAMVEAARYSFSFCYKNSRKETTWRIILVFAKSIIAYTTVCVSGYLMNRVQQMMGQKEKPHSFYEFAMGDMKWLLIFFVSIPLIGVVVGRLDWFFKSRWNQILKYANHREMNDHRATLDVATFMSRKFDDLVRKIGELPTSWQTRIWFSDELFNLVATLVSFVLFGISLIWYKPIYALILFVTALPMAIAELKYVGMWWNLFQEVVPLNKARHVLERAYHQTQAHIQANIFGQSKTLRSLIDHNTDDIIGRNEVLRRKGVRNELFSYTLSQLGFCGVIVHAIWQAVVNRTEIGTLTIIIASAKTFQGSIEAIFSLIADQWNAAKGVILIGRDFFGLKSRLKTPNRIVPRFEGVPKITFDNVSFRYPDPEGIENPNGRLVLDNVSFEIDPGTKVAIVGESGHGKSTLLWMLLRQYDPCAGNVFADDLNLRNIEPSDWCKSTSALTQDYTVLERRVGEEIASSRLDEEIDMEKVRSSARLACFDGVVTSHEKGYEARIGTEHGGREFSGGEKQRLALSRVFYRSPKVLILDEPDSRLDPKSANDVMDSIFGLTGITVIIITHHVARAERCDQVIVMKGGRVAEQGSPSELRALNGHYVSMLASDKTRRGEKKPESSDV